jgi:hypothetical protein
MYVYIYRLDEAESHILVNELFKKFDQDDSNDLNFEEFRNFYIKLLDSDECLDLLKKFAKYRFRNLVQEEALNEEHRNREKNVIRRERGIIST